MGQKRFKDTKVGDETRRGQSSAAAEARRERERADTTVSRLEGSCSAPSLAATANAPARKEQGSVANDGSEHAFPLIDCTSCPSCPGTTSRRQLH
jgi:hypothetical protein